MPLRQIAGNPAGQTKGNRNRSFAAGSCNEKNQLVFHHNRLKNRTMYIKTFLIIVLAGLFSLQSVQADPEYWIDTSDPNWIYPHGDPQATRPGCNGGYNTCYSCLSCTPPIGQSGYKCNAASDCIAGACPRCFGVFVDVNGLGFDIVIQYDQNGNPVLQAHMESQTYQFIDNGDYWSIDFEPYDP
jgi:hypothetical protein